MLCWAGGTGRGRDRGRVREQAEQRSWVGLDGLARVFHLNRLLGIAIVVINYIPGMTDVRGGSPTTPSATELMKVNRKNGKQATQQQTESGKSLNSALGRVSLCLFIRQTKSNLLR